MKKKVATTVLVTAATIGGSVVGAKADTIASANDTNTTTQSQVASKTPTNIDEAQKQVDQAAKDKATADQAAKDAAKDQENTQATQDQAAKDKATAQNEVDNSKADVEDAQKNKDDATDENIAGAKDKANQAAKDVTDAENGVDDANAVVDDSQTDVADAQKEVDSAKDKVDSAMNSQNTAQNIADRANQKVKDEADKLDNMTADNLNQQKDQVNQNVKDQQSSVDTTKTDLTNANNDQKQANAKVAENITNTQNKADKVTQAQSDADAAKKADADAKAAKKGAQAKVDSLQDQADAMPKINVDVAAWKKVVNDQAKISSLPADQQSGAQKAFLAEYQAFTAKIDAKNVYTPSTTDQAIKLTDYTDLTQDQRDELMSFALDLINQSITMWQGTDANNFTSTREDLTISQGLADAYSDTNTDMSGNHLLDRIVAIQQKYNLSQVGENWGGTLLSYMKNAGALTLGEMKRAIYQDIVGMMFEDADSNFGHMSNWTNNNGTGYVGIGFDKFGNTHYLIHTPFNSTGNPDTSALKHFDSLADVEGKLDSAKDVLNTATTKANTAAQMLKNANSALNEANTDNQQAQNALKQAQTDLTAKKERVATLTAKLTKVQNDLAASQAQLAQINDDLANFNEARTKQAKVVEQAKAEADKAATLLTNSKQQTAKAKADLATAQQALTSKQNALVTAKKAVLDAKQAVADKQSALVEANNEVDRLAHADSILEAAKQKLKTANAKLAQVQSDFDKAVKNNKVAIDKLNETKTVQDSANKTYQRAQQLVETLTAKKKLEEQLAKEAAEKATAEKVAKEAAEKAAAEKENQKNNGNTTTGISHYGNGRKDQNKPQKNTIDALKKYADELQKSAFLAQVNAIATGRVSDKAAADMLQKQADEAKARYEVAAKTLQDSLIAGEPTDNNNQVAIKGDSEKQVTMLNAKTGVVMPTVSHAKINKMQGDKAKVLPQTDEHEGTKATSLGGLLLVSLLGLLGIKRKRLG